MQLLDAADWRAVEYRVAVVQSRQDQTAGQYKYCHYNSECTYYTKNAGALQQLYTNKNV